MKKKKKKFVPPQSNIGRLIDLPLEDFKNEVVNQKVPIGVLNNVKINFLGSFTELRLRKDDIIQRISKGELSKDDPVVRKTLNGIYAEMTKIEQKSLYLTERVKELIDVDKDVVDSAKN